MFGDQSRRSVLKWAALGGGAAARPKAFSRARRERKTFSTLTVGWGNPSYAGTYVFGRYQACKQIGAGRRDLHSVPPHAAG